MMDWTEAHMQGDAEARAKIESKVDLQHIPDDWWLYGLFHNHTPIKFKGERHEPFDKQGDPWSCKLQHVEGGKLTEGTGLTPQMAVDAAIAEVELNWFDNEEER